MVINLPVGVRNLIANCKKYLFRSLYTNRKATREGGFSVWLRHSSLRSSLCERSDAELGSVSPAQSASSSLVSGKRWEFSHVVRISYLLPQLRNAKRCGARFGGAARRSVGECLGAPAFSVDYFSGRSKPLPYGKECTKNLQKRIS